MSMMRIYLQKMNSGFILIFLVVICWIVVCLSADAPLEYAPTKCESCQIFVRELEDEGAEGFHWKMV